MKKFKSILLAMTLVFATLTFVGCGSNNDMETTNTNNETSYNDNSGMNETDDGVIGDIGEDIVTDIEDIGNDIESGVDDMGNDVNDNNNNNNVNNNNSNNDNTTTR